MAIASITTGQANAVSQVQTVKKTSTARVNRNAPAAGGQKVAEKVTISQQARKAVQQADRSTFSIRTDPKSPEVKVDNVPVSSDQKNTEKVNIFQQAQQVALQAAADAKIAAREAAASKAAKASQAASEAKAAAAEQKGNSAKAALAALAAAAAQNANVELAVAAAQANNATQIAAKT